ncbi:kinase-like domain-containing protein [Talaromyces proteolyticus]|uniref:Kinase-like domain-containing protein n=1 Tax=Talaromyces proteolyticus TaxID=1131652 RepID=A0AAD4KMU9_9EURO|nr:kinase-like domain-containing protein [Talaromyces proteolyticus]KAH8696357.1 kinase-like domain-containing protein [Talaromyces proteolyticus]
MEMGNASHPVMFVKKLNLVDIKERYKALKKTYHENLVNLIDISLGRDAVYLVYERTGLSLKEIKAHGRVLFDEISVATICREMIHGLIYIHDVLKQHHGDLHCGNVYINEDGEVHIGDIGNSMIRKEDENGISHDIQAIYKIASSLLDIEARSDRRSMSFYLADHFTKLLSDIPLQELLKV